MLELVDSRERLLAKRHDLFENFLLALSEGLKLPIVIVENANRGSKAKGNGTMRDGESVFWIAYAASEHGINVHVKFGMFRQQFELRSRSLGFSSKRHRASRYRY